MSNSNQLMHAMIDAVFAKSNEEAVKEEGQRCAEAVQAAIREAQKRGECSSEEALRVCLAAIVMPSEPKPKSAPPPVTRPPPNPPCPSPAPTPITSILTAAGLSSATPVGTPGRPTPDEKPMTIQKIISKLHIQDDLEKDLKLLVGGVIRQDASLCCYACKQTILKEAGLQ